MAPNLQLIKTDTRISQYGLHVTDLNTVRMQKGLVFGSAVIDLIYVPTIDDTKKIWDCFLKCEQLVQKDAEIRKIGIFEPLDVTGEAARTYGISVANTTDLCMRIEKNTGYVSLTFNYVPTLRGTHMLAAMLRQCAAMIRTNPGRKIPKLAPWEETLYQDALVWYKKELMKAKTTVNVDA